MVHNKHVVNGLRDRGAVFVEELDQVPDDAIVIFSAHGVSRAVRDAASARGLKVFDATCPLVTKVHMEVTRASRRDHECVLIGHSGHPEVEGTMGQYFSEAGGIYLVESVADVATLNVKDPTQLHYMSQTTLSVDDTADIIDALRARFPSIQGPRKDDICYATQNRQDAVRELADEVDVLLVVGARNSSNSNRLRELGEKMGTRGYLIDSADCIEPAWLEGAKTVGVTAGASAPEVLVQEVVRWLQSHGGTQSAVEERSGREENVTFSIPPELRIL